jgi:hypothetical protein
MPPGATDRAVAAPATPAAAAVSDPRSLQGKISQERIRRGVFRRVLEWIPAIHDYIEDQSQHPKPFVWVKTAEEILARLRPASRLPNQKQTNNRTIHQARPLWGAVTAACVGEWRSGND